MHSARFENWKNLPRLAEAIATTGLKLSPESRDALVIHAGDCDDTVAGTLQASFIHQEPDLRVQGPLG